MKNMSSEMYKHTITLDISDELTRDFKRELTAFKTIYCEQKRAAAMLMQFRE